MAAAQAALVSARQQLATNESLTEGTTVDKHPNVERAAAKVREQYLAYARTVLPAPVSGYVAKRTVQVGQRIAPGAPLMSIIPLDQVWVDANFKEVQLAKMRIGQPVTLVADAYGDTVTYHGTLAGLGVGTGAAFALLPAQNATGNWIKVVQRVPVRITLDAGELAQHPLRVGLSMEASVDVANTQGGALSSASRAGGGYTTTAFDGDTAEADAIVLPPRGPIAPAGAHVGRSPGDAHPDDPKRPQVGRGHPDDEAAIGRHPPELKVAVREPVGQSEGEARGGLVHHVAHEDVGATVAAARRQIGLE